MLTNDKIFSSDGRETILTTRVLQTFSQPAFQMGSLLLLLTEAYDIKPNDAQCYQGNHT